MRKSSHASPTVFQRAFLKNGFPACGTTCRGQVIVQKDFQKQHFCKPAAHARRPRIIPLSGAQENHEQRRFLLHVERDGFGSSGAACVILQYARSPPVDWIQCRILARSESLPDEVCRLETLQRLVKAFRTRCAVSKRCRDCVRMQKDDGVSQTCDATHM